MNIGILIPGFSVDETDWAIPVQHNLMRILGDAQDVRIIALRYPHQRGAYQVFNTKVYPLGYTHRASGLKRLQLWVDTFKTIVSLHREKPFDVLHAMWADETGALAVWIARYLGIPSIVSVLGGELARVDGYGLQYGALSRWIVSQALNADCVLSACSTIDKLIITNAPSAKIQRFVLPVDTEKFCPNLERHRPFHLIHVASLVPVKDQVTLLKAMARLPKTVHLDILGDGSERQRLENLVKELQLEQRVIFHGAIPYDIMPEFFQSASLHVLCSKHEGLGMVTLEAAACGIPSISTHVGILPDLSELGLTVPIGDDEALAKSILELLENELKRKSLGNSARQKVEAEFSLEKGLMDLAAIYEKVIVKHC